MSEARPPSRRDARYPVPPGSSWIEFDHPVHGERCRAELTMVSVAGVGFVLDPSIDEIEPGAMLSGTSLQIGDCVVAGDMLVRNSVAGSGGRTRLGGLFYPETHELEQKFTVAIAALEQPGSRPEPGALHIRCKECHDSIRFGEPAEPGKPTRAVCATCGQKYVLKLPGSKAATDRLYARARGLAMEIGIDLPGAHSVLCRVMDLDQVLALQQQAPSAQPEPEPDVEQARGLQYDPAFQEAVEAGRLTPIEALHRGDRDACAAGIAAKHRLPMKTALEVADNRISLLEALRERTTVEAEPVQLELPARFSRAAVTSMFAVGLVIVVALSFILLFDATSTDQVARARQQGGLSVQKNDGGQIVRIEGPDPAAVLEAYCKSGEFEALGLAESPSDGPGVKLGILSDAAGSESRFAIYISVHRSTQRWSAGNGRSPLVAFQAPQPTLEARGPD